MQDPRDAPFARQCLGQTPVLGLHSLLGGDALGDVLNRQQQQRRVIARSFHAPRVQLHDARPQPRKVVPNLVVVELAVTGQDVFQQRPQFGDVPLSVPKFIDQAPLGFLVRHPERPVERPPCRAHPQIGSQDKHGFSDRVHDVLRVGLRRLRVARRVLACVVVSHCPSHFQLHS